MSDNNYRDMVPASDKDVKILKRKKPTHSGEDKAVYDVREAKSNSYSKYNAKMIKELQKE